MLPILTPAESAAWDEAAAADGIALATLMDAAGRAAAAVLAQRLPHALTGTVLVACGTGHNGGDGWVLARALHVAGARVRVAALPGACAPLTAQVAELARRSGVGTVAPDGPWPGCTLAVDAILGTGARGAPRAAAQALLDRLHDLAVPMVAIDGPSGVDLGSGVVHGAARADLTLTFGGLRRGHLLAREEMGDLVVLDIGHPPLAVPVPRFVTEADAVEWLPALGARDHKGVRGRIVVVGGQAGMSGALRLAGRAAFGAGGGLVHAVAEADTVGTLVAAEPDLQTLALPFDARPAQAALDLVTRADVLVIGPGLGRAPERRVLVLALLEAARRAVVDADALVALQRDVDALRTRAGAIPIVLTPHAGEFRTLFPEHAGDWESDPWRAARDAAATSGCTVLLKGVPTVVASPGGALLTVGAGNPGLATGGSGDVLSGLIGAFLARGLEPAQAAALGAQALGRAADLAARRHGARAMRPMDVIAALPDLWRSWEVQRAVRRLAAPPVLLDLPAPRTA